VVRSGKYALTGVEPVAKKYAEAVHFYRANHLLGVIKSHKHIDRVCTIENGYASGMGYTAEENAFTAHPNVDAAQCYVSVEGAQEGCAVAIDRVSLDVDETATAEARATVNGGR
jgi:hypothetical protein